MKQFLIAVLMTVLTCGVALGEPTSEGKALTVRTFHFNFKEADKAAAVIKQLMSSEGSMSIQPAANSLVITDHPENMKQIAQALTEFDSAARAFKVSIRLITAARVEGSPRIPDELRELAPKLAMVRYNSFEDLGVVDWEGHEGEPGLVELANGYRADFRVGEYDPSSNTVKVDDLRVSKLQGAQHDQLTQVLKSSLNQRALMLVIVARQ